MMFYSNIISRKPICLMEKVAKYLFDGGGGARKIWASNRGGVTKKNQIPIMVHKKIHDSFKISGYSLGFRSQMGYKCIVEKRFFMTYIFSKYISLRNEQ